MPEIPFQKRPKRKKILKLFLVFVGVIMIFIILVNFLPKERIVEKGFFKNERPLVIAHQGGELLAPSNTMVAFRQAVEMGVDVIETDIHITKDGYLVAIHDPTVDRTTDGTGSVAEMTLEEIQSLDAGYHFKDLNGQYSYRGKGIYIPTVEEMFKEFSNVRIEIEIKDDNPPERIDEISEKLWKLTEKYNMEDKLLVAAFDQDIIRTFEKYSGGEIAVAGGRQEVKDFVLFHKLFLRNLYTPEVDALQVPTEDSGFDLTEELLIEGAHRLGLNMHYWTIDDVDVMKKLIEKGADGILTNRPDLLIELLNEMGYE